MPPEFMIAAIAAFVASLAVCRAVIDMGPRDMPVAPLKTHAAPTPTAGGVGIAAGAAVGMALLFLAAPSLRGELNDLWRVIVFAYALLAIGFVDDVRPLGARTKLVLYIFVCLIAAASGGVVQDLTLGEWKFRLPYAIGLFGAALWMFTLINAVNFMDGANGLALGAAGIGLLGLAAIGIDRDALSVGGLALCAAAGVAGFLVWNFPRGALFAGDAGALFTAAVAGLGSLYLISERGVSPFVPPILFFPLLSDALLTLLRRARTGHPLLAGHKDHLYQRALAAGLTLRRVVLAYWIATAACGGLALLASRDESGVTGAATIVALALGSATFDGAARRRLARRCGTEA